LIRGKTLTVDFYSRPAVEKRRAGFIFDGTPALVAFGAASGGLTPQGVFFLYLFEQDLIRAVFSPRRVTGANRK
jgi:hypothetical protein